MDNIEEEIKKHYDQIGWKIEEGTTKDTRSNEDLRNVAQDYLIKCAQRILRRIPDQGDNILDMGSGPIPHDSYLLFSKKFQKRYCIDISKVALDAAKKKIGNHGVFLHGSFLDIPLEKDFFDCSISLHVIYHIEKNKQEAAVRKLIHVTKPGHPVIIIYSNPNSITKLQIFKITKNVLKKTIFKKRKQGPVIYFYAHPLKWWDRFNDEADLNILPYRSFDTRTQKYLIPNNNLGKMMFSLLYKLEERFPAVFVRYFTYPMIILKKH